jgi:hypothetical protein
VVRKGRSSMDENTEAIARGLQNWIVMHGGYFTRAAVVTIGRKCFPAVLYTTDGRYAPDDYLYVVGRRPAYEALVPADDPDMVYLPVRQLPCRQDMPYEPYRCYLRAARVMLHAPGYDLGIKRERPVHIQRLSMF